MFYVIVSLVTGAWLITQSFILSTKNFSSTIYFKILPFTLGILCLYSGAKSMGWV